MLATSTSLSRTTLIGAILAIALAIALLGTATSTAQTPAEAGHEPTLAQYGDEVIDMSQEGWAGAGACLVAYQLEMPECFDTEAEMNDRLVEIGGEVLDGRTGPPARKSAFASCSVSLRLYDGTYYSAGVLHLTLRNTWLNLSNYGFNQRTSSVRVGACSTYWADWNNGGGGWYPTNLTRRWALRPTLLAGWNNDISSVFIR